MTKLEIIRLAREAGYQHPDAVGSCEDFAYFDLERFAALIAAVEREACALVCEDMSICDEASYYVASIRARGENKMSTVSGLDIANNIEREWRVKCDAYINLLDANAKELDRAMELLRRAENEMRYAGWTRLESDNPARNGVYEQIKRFLK